MTRASGRGEVTIDAKAGENGALSATLAAATVVSTDAVVTPLDAQETSALLGRLEPLPIVQNASAPVIRPSSAPPPRAGAVQPIAFVAPSGRQVADKPITPAQSLAPLAAPMVLPVGEVDRESEIRVRFAEPMIAVAQVGSAAKLSVTIKPDVKGTWRWIDTRVAQFTSEARRLPAATEFTITIAAGAKAISGATLVSEVTSTFSTPPVRIVGTYPTVTLRPDSPIAIKFDQEVDPKALEKFLRVEAIKNKKRFAFQLTTLDAAKTAWAKNPAIKFSEEELGRYYAVIAPKAPWPSGLEGHVVLAAKAPSREGPRVSERETAARFSIAQQFLARGIYCDDMPAAKVTGAVCSANGYLTVELTNPIELSTYRSSKIQIVGDRLQDHKPSSNTVYLSTPDVIGRSFDIAIGDGIRDIYGQDLVGRKQLSFVTGRNRYQPYLWADDGMFVLDPRFDIPQWIVHTQAIGSLRVQLFQVEPKDYFAFNDFERGKRSTVPGKQVWDKTFDVGPRHGAIARVDLRPALATSGTGHLIALATGTGLKRGEKRRAAWIQVSRLGVTARIDGEKVNAWTQDITPSRFLKPIAGVKATLLVPGRSDVQSASTDTEGHAAFDLLDAKPHKTVVDGEDWDDVNALLVVEHGNQSTFTPIHAYEKAVREQHARWYVTDDRFTYKPGEPVYVKGWVRWTNTGVNPDLALPAASDTIDYTLTDSRGNKIATGKAPFTAQGGFDVEVKLPANVNLGTAYFSFGTKTEGHRHPISIQEFRTPAYAVTLNDDVTHSGATPLVLGETIEMNAEAKYYAGGGLGGAGITWAATLAQATYRPPGWDRYSFAPLRDRSQRGYYGYYGNVRAGTHRTSAERDTTLSGASTSGITFGLAALPAGEPSILTVDATVTDIDRQTIRASSRPILVHPSTIYVGVRLMPDDDDTLQLVATDIDGNALAGVPIEVTIEGVLGSERFRDDAKIVDTQQCKTTSATTPATCRFTRKDLQTAYVAVARVADSRGRVNVAQYDIPWWTWADEDFAVVPDKKMYRPGEVAKLDVRSKQLPAVAVVSFSRNGIVAQKRIELTKPSTVVELPIDKAYVPNVFVVVDRWAKRAYQQGTGPLPDHTSTQLELAVDLESARLSMRTRPLQALVEPGEEATFEVEVKHDDKPKAGAEVALMVVDEAVLALSNSKHQDPLGNFYSAVADGTWAATTLDLVHDDGDELAGAPGFERYSLDDGTHSGFGTGSGGGTGWGTIGSGRYGTIGHGSGTGIVVARKDFRATAVFSPTLTTDEHGKVRLTVKMPDSLTRFRIVALATADTRYFGKAESAIVTQRKVNARTVAPRFLTQGDTFQLPVVVQNLDRAPRTIEVAVRAANLTLGGAAGKRVTVPGGQRAEVRFDFSTQERGRAVIQTIAVSGAFADASNVELPVYEPATTESFATYGVVDDKPQFEQLRVPANIFADVGGVEAEVSSTQLQNLTDAYWYLYAYPFECAEQRSSRMLATTSLYDILDAFATPGRPSKQEIAEQRARDVKKLTRDQLPDGGWGYFRGMRSDPYVTMQVLTALAAGKERGPAVKNAIGYVTKQANALQAKLDKATGDAQKSAEDAYNVSLLAASLSSLASAGVDVGARADKLHRTATALRVYPIDAKARVLALVARQDTRRVMREKLLADLLSAVHETAAAATVTTQYTESERLLLVSNHKTTALALDAIMREAPDQSLVTKLARGLLDGRRRGRWISTQENLVVLQAMRRYFDTYEKDTPSYTGKLWFGTAAYAEQTFKGRSSARGVSQLDWSTLAPGSTHDLAMVKDGPGRMYYRIGITYAPKQTNLPPLDAGFVVRRTYRGVDDPKDVVVLPDGRVKIKLGARVLVQLEAINTSKRHAVALVDPLPAGLEAVNTNLATSERAAAGSIDDAWDHTEMRDNRSEAFAMHLQEGTHAFSYTARATTPGTFVAAPAKAEEMYSPETFGRSAGATVVIE